MGIYKIKGTIQDYAWGGNSFIPQLLGESASAKKAAEYWLGAHSNAPSIIQRTGEKLDRLISNDPTSTLGEKVAIRFGRLPFLFKVLDVQDMLSIQVHPTKQEAELGFLRENALGIPLSAPHRNYKDDNHKPEIMVALSKFWLLHGFKPADQLRQTLRNTPELNHLEAKFIESDYQELYKYVMEESPEQTNETLSPLIKRILPGYEEGKFAKSTPEFWAARAFKTFCHGDDLDKGIYSIFFFNILEVNKGEAVFQDAGVPHAYLAGQNIELMANSDNVLRGGLTPKFVDVPELLKHIRFNETRPKKIKGSQNSAQPEIVYNSPAEDFELSRIALDGALSYTKTADSLEILLAVEGNAAVSDHEEILTIHRGEAILITSGTSYQITSNELVAYKATCPI